MSIWREILAGSVGASALVGVVVWLTKSIIANFLTKDIENYKEKIKNSLKIIEIEHETRFNTLHLKRAELIAELYSKIRSVQLTSFSLFDGYILENHELEFPQKEKKKLVEFKKAFRELNELYVKNRIFFREQTCLKIDEMINIISDPVKKIAEFESIPDGIKEDMDEVEEKYDTIIKTIENYNPKEALTALEEEFRELLGVDKNAYNNQK